MVCGYPPFYDQNPFGVYKKILKGSIKFPSSVTSLTQSAVKSFLNSRRFRRLGCTSSVATDSLKKHKYFRSVDWASAEAMLMVPPYTPTILTDGDTSNFDYFPEESVEEGGNLTADERNVFAEMELIVGRSPAALLT